MHQYNAYKLCERFGESFKYHRQRLGLSYMDISEACGISTSVQAKWERGVCSPGLFCLVALADYMGITIDELIGRERRNAENG